MDLAIADEVMDGRKSAGAKLGRAKRLQDMLARANADDDSAWHWLVVDREFAQFTAVYDGMPERATPDTLSLHDRDALRTALREDIAEIVRGVEAEVSTPKFYRGEALPLDPSECEDLLVERITSAKEELEVLKRALLTVRRMAYDAAALPPREPQTKKPKN